MYVENLVHAIILASTGLSDEMPGKEGKPIAAGEAYFISDGNDMLPSLPFTYYLV